MQKPKPKKSVHKEKKQPKPGIESRMSEAPVFDSKTTGPNPKLEGKVALISGGDSGIGRAVALCFAKHGADLALCFLKEEAEDARQTKALVEQYGARCLLIPGDLSREAHCNNVVKKVYAYYRRIDILINNASTHYPKDRIDLISAGQLKATFGINMFGMFYLAKAALHYMKEGSCIVNTASVTAYRGSAHLIDYAATKGAIVSFTRSLAASLLGRKIRVNAVAPGPVWTPLIISSMKPEEIKVFGSTSPMGRAAQPVEIAPSYLFLASDDASYMTGQVLHPNGGEIVNG